MKRIPKLMSIKKPVTEKGITAQPVKLRKRVKTGANTKLKVFAFVGITLSFNNNFKPSARGCNKPRNPTTFGPFLCWIEPIIFLSASVKYATDIKTGTTITKKLRIFSNIKNIKIKNFSEVKGFEPLIFEFEIQGFNH